MLTFSVASALTLLAINQSHSINFVVKIAKYMLRIMMIIKVFNAIRISLNGQTECNPLICRVGSKLYII